MLYAAKLSLYRSTLVEGEVFAWLSMIKASFTALERHEGRLDHGKP
ncbi:hypothetical protein WEI85_21325 [Actinomycetes bacterium KLBMP 9797]